MNFQKLDAGRPQQWFAHQLMVVDRAIRRVSLAPAPVLWRKWWQGLTCGLICNGGSCKIGVTTSPAGPDSSSSARGTAYGRMFA